MVYADFFITTAVNGKYTAQHRGILDHSPVLLVCQRSLCQTLKSGMHCLTLSAPAHLSSGPTASHNCLLDTYHRHVFCHGLSDKFGTRWATTCAIQTSTLVNSFWSPAEGVSVSAVLSELTALEALCDNAMYKLILTLTLKQLFHC